MTDEKPRQAPKKDLEFLRRVRSAVFHEQGLGHLSKYVQESTFIRGRPFSMKGYEFQEAILDDPCFDAVTGKPRQVGATELFLRLGVSFLATTPDSGGMLMLPHVKKALAMVKSRVDPIIQGSTPLKALVLPGSDSSAFKAIGTSQLHAAGTWSGDVISVPIDIRLTDEYDYHNLITLATSDATMDNSVFVCPHTGQRGVRRDFSTPLTPKRGVHARFALSDKKRRLVKAPCNHWFWPHYENVVVDGWDKPVIELVPDDIHHLEQRGLLPTARILCPECRKVLPHRYLAPEYREWVAEAPHISYRSGWWVTPFDLPFDPFGRPKRTPEWLVRSRVAFGSSIAKFYNHRLGLPYADLTNSFSDAAIAENAVLYPMSPGAAALSPSRDLYGLCAGVDTGKPCWGAVGRPLPNGCVDVLWLFTVQLSDPGGEDLPQRIQSLLAPYRLKQLVIDGQPYTDAVLTLQSRHPDARLSHDAQRPHSVLACDYRLRDTSLSPVQVKPSGLEVTTHRTRTLSSLANAINSGKWRFPRPDLLPLVGHDTTRPGTLRNHASNITKINTDPEQDSEGGGSGEQGAEWVGDNDHFVHALNYLSIAASVVRALAYQGAFAPTPQPRPCVPGSAVPDPGAQEPRAQGSYGGHPTRPGEPRIGYILDPGGNPIVPEPFEALQTLAQTMQSR